MKEAQEAAEAFGYALSFLGYDAKRESFDYFASVNPDALGQTVGRYKKLMIGLTLDHRDVAHRLTIAFYRFLRALMTGTTYALPGERAGTTTLTDLRDEFLEVINEAVPTRTDRPSRKLRRDFTRARLDSPIPTLKIADGDEEISEETFDWPEDISADEAEGITDTRLDNMVDILRKRKKEREAEAKKAYEDMATKQAGMIQQNVQNAGRKTLQKIIDNDKKVIGYARLSRTGDPCHFCAMLMSRGFVFKSDKVERGGTLRSDLNLYHDGCNCYSMPVYSREQYESDPRFALNRQLSALWDKTISGQYSGNEAINEWRYVIRQRRVSTRTTRRTAQAAAA